MGLYDIFKNSNEGRKVLNDLQTDNYDRDLISHERSERVKIYGNKVVRMITHESYDAVNDVLTVTLLVVDRQGNEICSAEHEEPMGEGG